jgi:NADH-quinone oxidoreductase subunit J
MNTWPLINAIVVLAALGLFWLLPRGRRSRFRFLGAIATMLALLMLAAGFLLQTRPYFAAARFWFTFFAVLALASAVLMICQRQPLYSALYFVVTTLCVAALLLLQKAQFLAVALVIIYTGAILVVYVFVLMLSRQEHLPAYDTTSRQPLPAVIIGFILLGALLQFLLIGLPRENPAALDDSLAPAIISRGSVESFGREIFDHHLIALIAAALVLLVAAVGAITLARGAHGKPAPAANSEDSAHG